jgi:hypothetical protein
LYYNTSTARAKNDDDQVLVTAERLYEKMLENITNRVVTSLSDNISSVSAFVEKVPSEHNRDDGQMSAAYLDFNEEHKLFKPEDKDIERNSFKERPDVQAGFRRGAYPHVGQAWHPNFERSEYDLDNTASLIQDDESDADVAR